MAEAPAVPPKPPAPTAAPAVLKQPEAKPPAPSPHAALRQKVQDQYGKLIVEYIDAVLRR